MSSERAAGPEISSAERLVTLLCGMPAAMTYTIMTPIMPKLVEMHGATASGKGMMIRLALTVVGISMALGSLLGGWLVRRIGVKRAVIGSASVWIVAGCLDVFVGDLRPLIVLRFIEGAGTASLMVSGVTLLGLLPDELKRGAMAGWQTLIATVAGLVTQVLAGMIGDIQWRWVFLLHLLALPIVLAAVRLPTHIAPPRTQAVGGSGFWRRYPYALAALAFLFGLTTFAMSTFGPFLFHALGVDKPSGIAAATTASTFTAGVFAAMYGPLRRRLSAKMLFAVALATSTIGATIVGLASSYWAVVGGLLLFGAGVGPLIPNLYALILGASPRERAPILGIMKALYYGSAFVAAAVFEPVMRAHGPHGVVFAVAGLLLALAISVLLVFKQLSPLAPQPELAAEF